VGLSVFDLDNTLLTVNSCFKYYFFLLKKKTLSNLTLLKTLRYFLKFSSFDYSPALLHEKAFTSFLKGKQEREIFGSKVNEFLDKYLEQYLNQQVVSHLKKALDNKRHVLLLSNSPKQIVEPIASRLNVMHYKATTYQVDACGRLIKILNAMDGKDKAQYTLILANKLNIQKKEIEVFSDSIWDRPLLEIAGNPIAVTPDKKLLALAKANSWKILWNK